MDSFVCSKGTYDPHLFYGFLAIKGSASLCNRFAFSIHTHRKRILRFKYLFHHHTYPRIFSLANFLFLSLPLFWGLEHRFFAMALKLVLIAVSVLDLIAFSLAVAAEQRRSSAKIATDANSNYCVYDSNGATGLGVCAFLFLMASQILIMAATKCLCCGRPLRPSRSRVWAIVFFISCWMAFFIAEVCLLAGSVRNAYHTKYRPYLSQNPPSCETLRKGVFGAGAAFIFFTGLFSELFYVSYSKTGDGFLPRDTTGIRMGSI